MSAGKLNITIEQGATFSRTIALKDASNVAVDLTGASVRGKMRPAYSSDTSVSFTLTINSPASAGTIAWSMSAATTDTLSTYESAKWIYDIEVQYAGGTVQRILQGTAVISQGVTR